MLWLPEESQGDKVGYGDSLGPGAVGFVDVVLCSADLGQCWFMTVVFCDTVTVSVNSPRHMISDYSLIPIFMLFHAASLVLG